MSLIKLFYYIVFLTNYLLSNYLSEVEIDNPSDYPKIIKHDIYKIGNYKQIGNFDISKALRLLFPSILINGKLITINT